MLTNYSGQAITYDAIGNPTKWGNTTYSWDAGRRLMTLNKSGVSASFTYDINGYRTKKTVNGVTTTYYLDGDTITALKKGTDELIFIYDEKGMVIGFYHNGEPYVYVKNLQGDIIGIVDINYDMVVSYKYDAWGKQLSVTGELANTLGKLNPFRYRGYVYDDETGLYYLNSRYYDAQVGRFLNADKVVAGVGGEVQGYNLYAYCFNNPVNMDDPLGDWPKLSTILKAAAIVVAAVAVVATVAVTVASCGASSIAATIVISSAITLAAKTTEVAVLQGKKSANEGKDKEQIATDIVDAVVDNRSKIIGTTPVTKTIGYTVGFYSQSSTFQDVIQLQKLDGFNLKTMAGATIYEVENRFTDFRYSVSTTASKRSMALSYGLAAIDVTCCLISILSDSPDEMANIRGYKLR